MMSPESELEQLASIVLSSTNNRQRNDQFGISFGPLDSYYFPRFMQDYRRDTDHEPSDPVWGVVRQCQAQYLSTTQVAALLREAATGLDSIGVPA